MDHEEINAIQIQRYLDGEMTQQEQKDFEIKLTNDSELQYQVKEYQRLTAGIRYKKRVDAWEKIKDIEAELANDHTDKVIQNRKFWPYWAIAATVTLLIIGFIFLLSQDNLLLFNDDQTRLNALVEQNFSPYPVLAYGPSRSESDDSTIIEKAFNAYNNGNHAEAISYFRKVQEQNKDPLILLYLGNSYLVTHQPQASIEILNELIRYDTELSTQAKWYLSLAYLKNGDEVKARALLNELSKGSSSYRSKAKTLLNQL